MAKKQKQPTKTCTDCIHESACRIWTDGRLISDASASVCPNHETVKESAAYLCGVLDERKRKQTNADRIRVMSDEELAKELFLFTELDDKIEYCKNLQKCGDILNSGKLIPDEDCTACILDWLRQPVKEGDTNG